MIKYFVRTTTERKIHDSYNQIPYELLIDYEHNSGKAFLEQLEIINEYDAVLLEDDCILCENFKEEIEKVIKQYPNKIINFFTRPRDYFYTKECPHFSYNQCTYYPKGVAKQILNVIKENHLECNSQERMTQKALLILNWSHITYRPCLVQHIDNNTLMWEKVYIPRRTPYFVDYLKELGITYEDAQKEENKSKLLLLMKEKFKK